MFEAFSSGYYLGRLYVEPSDDGTAGLHTERLQQVSDALYDDADLPLVMKLGATHFPVVGRATVPDGTLAVPRRVLDLARVENPPSLEAVLLAKAGHARRLLDIGVVE